jgi:hypothetical protein
LGLASATHAEPALRRQTPVPSLSRTDEGGRRHKVSGRRRTPPRAHSSYTRGIYTQRTHARHARPLHWPLTARATRPTCMLAQLLDPHTPAAHTTRSNAHNASLQQIAIRWTHYGQTRLGHVQPTRTNALVVDRHRMAWLMANTSHNARKI